MPPSLRNITKTATRSLGCTTTYSFDPNGNGLTKVDPGASPCTQWTSAGGTTTDAYNGDNQLTGITYSDGVTPNVSGLTYNGVGQRTAMTDGTGSSSWVYDSLNRLTSVTNGNGAQVQTAYNLRNLPTTLTYPGTTGAVTNGYDSAGRMTSVQDWNGKQTTFGYDSNSNLTTETLPSTTGVVDSNTFDAANNLTGIADAKGATSIFSATYTRDSANQLATDTSVPSTVGSYKYSGLNQLCYAGSANTTACTSPPTGSYPYTYDTADNLTKTENSNDTGSATQTFNSADEVCWTVAGGSVNPCATAPSGANIYGYDTRGDRTSFLSSSNAGTCHAYDQAMRQTSIKTGTGATCTTPTTIGTYAYNGGGIRTSKTVGANTTQYAWGGSLMLQEKVGTSATSYIYGPGGAILEEILPAGTTYYYHHDQIGSTRALTDASGVAQATYRYDPYGNLTTSTGSVVNPFQFSGQYKDADKGFITATQLYANVDVSFAISNRLLLNVDFPFAIAQSGDSGLQGPGGAPVCH